MDVAVVLDHRFYPTRDGWVWTDGPFAYSFFTLYLEQFDRVRVAARVKEVELAEAVWLRVGGEGVSFAVVPYYVGPYQYSAWAVAVRQALRHALRPDQAVILRVPSQLGLIAARALRRWARPFGSEIVGDPYAAYAPWATRSRLRPLFRACHARALRRICQQAKRPPT